MTSRCFASSDPPFAGLVFGPEVQIDLDLPTRLLAFTKTLETEEARAGDEGLDQEQLAFYDLALVPGVKLSAKDREVVKKIARAMPKKIERKLVIDWRKTQRARAAVKAAIKDALDELPDAYGPELYEKLVEATYEHVYESYWGEGKSKYGGEAAADWG